MTCQREPIEWKASGVPVSQRFDDPYYSLDNGLDETRHVFLQGNDLPARFADGFHIAELGFGTGLNLLTAWQAWQAAGTPGTLQFTSFEAYPMEADDIARALSAFPELDTDLVVNAFTTGQTRIQTDGLEVQIIPGDARDMVPAWDGLADAWFLDGFSPAKNPELWDPELLAAVGRHTAPSGTLATYTAAGHVRRALADAGFEIHRVPGFGRKRHMSVGRLK
ncbi:tRNA (5-methylaminomethyl-2-thiouridine)(34)-methyltransferase MnmD [Litoreibacter roseus]|uniref:FAD-dependent oxidoreductase n=1 Tax=Litoreibacter roseus TaxID=2601869 RepID=A0A6N6JHW8_9RHOB|nr:tRNA (5-methylaminomethyl-2-thiouridine)(34)-methyltransferase MnmD [Litoreibacter roseus]GFE64989.1 FAD-dependent oxidoreductase [Litoreibacter roseus]